MRAKKAKRSVIDKLYLEGCRVFGPFSELREGWMGVGVFSPCGGYGVFDTAGVDSSDISRDRSQRRRSYHSLLRELEEMPDASAVMLNYAWIEWWRNQGAKSGSL